MPEENFYLDNPDLKFQMEQVINWEKIIALKEDIGNEDCPYDNAEEAKATYLEMMEDPIGSLAGQRIAPRAEEVDAIGCQFGREVGAKERVHRVDTCIDGGLDWTVGRSDTKHRDSGLDVILKQVSVVARDLDNQAVPVQIAVRKQVLDV